MRAVGVGFSFQYQDSSDSRWIRKRTRLVGRIRNECPHIHSITHTGSQYEIQSAFVTPSGSLNYYCMICRSVRPMAAVQLFIQDHKAMMEHDPSATVETYRASRDKTQKLIRKLNRLGGAP